MESPFPITLIDLVKSETERFVREEDDGPKLVVGHGLDFVKRDRLHEIIHEGKPAYKTDEEKLRLREEQIKYYMDTVKVPRELAEQIVMANENQDNSEAEYKGILEQVNQSIVNLSQDNLESLALQILEYDMVSRGEGINVSTLDDAVEVSAKLNTNANPELYKASLNKFGFVNAQASGNIPFIMCSYGFTRKHKEPEQGAVLTAFTSESRHKKSVYGAKLKTEGILFELDRKKIIQWLVKNDFIKPEDNVPEDLNDDQALRTWFFNNVQASAVKVFNPIDQENYRITSYVYTLIHSLSHALLRQAAHLCGLDKNSLSEYIFPNVPGFLIYCQNSQGFNIGALFNLFEAYFDKWLHSTAQYVEKCIYDPICLDRDSACSGCLYLNEISCVHFNKDLNRRFLLGWYDKTNDTRLYGFWEDLD